MKKLLISTFCILLGGTGYLFPGQADSRPVEVASVETPPVTPPPAAFGIVPKAIPEKTRYTVEILPSASASENKAVFWEGTWRDLAREEGLDPDFSRQTEELLTRSLPMFRSDVYLSPEHREAYAKSLRNFMRTQGKPSQWEFTRQEVGYWLTYCALEADKRYCLKNEDRVNEKYRRLFRNIAERGTRQALRQALSPEDYRMLGAEIDAGMKTLEDRLLEKIKPYQEDFLCPFYRGALDDAVVEDLDKIEHIGKNVDECRDQHKRMISNFFRGDQQSSKEIFPSSEDRRKEHFRKGLSVLFDGTLYGYVLFQIAEHETMPSNGIGKNEYWGYMYYGANSGYENFNPARELLRWPLRVSIRPADDLNKKTNWKRSDGPVLSGPDALKQNN
jgi:hypothetical protein